VLEHGFARNNMAPPTGLPGRYRCNNEEIEKSLYSRLEMELLKAQFISKTQNTNTKLRVYEVILPILSSLLKMKYII